MLNTAQLRVAWRPPCKGPWITKSLHGEGNVTVRPAIWQAVDALNAMLVLWDYRTRQKDTGAYNCRKITGGTADSLHSFGIALDINWLTNPYSKRLITDMPPEMVKAICRIRTNNGKQVWNWGGYWSNNKDAMHYEIVCTPADLATGISSLGPAPAAPVLGPLIMEESIVYLRNKDNGEIWALSATHCKHLTGDEWNARVQNEGAKYFDVDPLVLYAFTVSAGRVRV